MAIPRVPDFSANTSGVIATSKLSALAQATSYAINPTGCAVQLAATQNITSASTPLITFDTKTFDSGAQITVPGTSITVAEAGLYDVGAWIAWQSNSAGYRLIQVEVNGTTVTQCSGAPANGNATSQVCSARVLLAAGDAVATRVTQNSASTLTASGRMWAVRETGT